MKKTSNPEYPVELPIEIENCSAIFRLRIEGDESSKTIEGIVESVHYSLGQGNFEDDEDAPDNTVYAEKKTIQALVQDLQKQFPDARINGSIKCYSQLLGYNNPREYDLSEILE